MAILDLEAFKALLQSQTSPTFVLGCKRAVTSRLLLLVISQEFCFRFINPE